MQVFPVSYPEARRIQGNFPEGRAKIVGSRNNYFVEVTEQVYAGKKTRIKADYKFMLGRVQRRANP